VNRVRTFGVPVACAALVAVMLGWAYWLGPGFVGAPAPQELPQEAAKLVRISLEEAFEISSQIVQLFVSILFGLFVIVGYALSRERRDHRAVTCFDIVAGCAFIGSTFVCFYLAYQLKYGQYATIQHGYTQEGLRQTVAWFNEVHAKLALWVGISAIPAFFIVARSLFAGQVSEARMCPVGPSRRPVAQEPADPAPAAGDEVAPGSRSEKRKHAKQEKSNA